VIWSTQVDEDNNIVQQGWTKSTPHDCAALTLTGVYFGKAECLVMRVFEAEGGSLNDLHVAVTSEIRQQFNLQIAGQFKSVNEFRRSCNRRLREAVTSPPTTLAELLEVPAEMCVTNSNDRFLQIFEKYDESVGTVATILVFATEADLRRLCAATHIFVDGTFKITPVPFYAGGRSSGQVFTLNELFGNTGSERLYTRAFCILSRKTALAYETALRLIIDKVQREFSITSIQWQKITADFELEVAVAFLAVAHLVVRSALALEGCFMHYCSALVKKMKSLGLAAAYSDESSGLGRFVNKLFALSFLPPDAVTDMFIWIINNKLPFLVTSSVHAQAFGDFLEYFSSQWLTNRVVPIEVWNVYYRTDHRTNNDLEGLHRESLRLFRIHSDLWSFIRVLKSFQNAKEISFERHSHSGHPPVQQRRRARLQQQELTQLRGHFEISQKQLQDCYEYLCNVSFKMRRYNFNEVDDDDDEE